MKFSEKLTSARFLMAISFTVTSCVLAIMKILPPEAFTGLCGVVLAHYFGKNRNEPKI
jgi:hypothetical protein